MSLLEIAIEGVQVSISRLVRENLTSAVHERTSAAEIVPGSCRRAIVARIVIDP